MLRVLVLVLLAIVGDGVPLTSLKQYKLVTPKTQKLNLHLNNNHPVTFDFKFTAFDKEFEINMEKNTDFIASDYKEVEMGPDGNILNIKQNIINCYYHGTAKGDENSYIGLSTCNGLHGVIQAHGEHLHIEPGSLHESLKLMMSTDPVHVVYRQSDIMGLPESFCGVHDKTVQSQNATEYNATETATSSRHLLATCPGGPTKYVEAFIFNDVYRFNREGPNTASDTLNIANIADGYYRPSAFKYCVKIVVKGQITFSSGNPTEMRWRACNTKDPDPRRTSFGPGCYDCDLTTCKLSSDKANEIDTSLLLDDFTKWIYGSSASPSTIRTKIEGIFNAKIDNAHMFVGAIFAGPTKGLGWVGTMCGLSSTGISEFTIPGVPGYHAQIYAHEMGHNFGMNHDTGMGYIMQPASSSESYPTAFSAASISNINDYFTQKYDAGVYPKCLENDPGSQQTQPVCGNGITEQGEQCDPGLKTDICCIGCKLASNCVCATTQECCDSRGQFKAKNIECRASVHPTCDIAETCTGTSAFCPEDKVQQIGTACTDSSSFPSVCYKGLCVPARITQCRSINNGQYPNSGGCDSGQDCSRLECSNAKGDSWCGTSWNLPPVDGTPCGGATNPNSKFCLAGVCKLKSDLTPGTNIICPTSNLNMRSSSSTTSSILWTATPLEAFEVIQTAMSWVNVRARNGGHCGQTAWAQSASFALCLTSITC